MDVQQPRCAENSIKICSLCFDTKFRRVSVHQRRFSSEAALTCGAVGEKWRQRFLIVVLTISEEQQIYDPVALFCCLVLLHELKFHFVH